MIYRKKPVVVDAWQLYRDAAMPDFILEAVNNNIIIIKTYSEPQSPFDHSYEKLWYEIKTLEGTMIANEGDYIIRGVKGEYYPCKSDIFEQTYEELNNE